VEDVRSAVAYVKAHAKELGADPGRIVLLGRSAGGQLALCAAYEHADPSVRGVAAFYAPNDLVYAYSRPSNPRIMDSRAVISAYMGGPPDKAAALYTRASPLEMVGPKTPPTFLLHGLRDELVWKVHSERLEERLRSAGRPGYFLRLPWATHGCDYNLSGPCGQLTLYAMERFLSAVTR